MLAKAGLTRVVETRKGTGVKASVPPSLPLTFHRIWAASGVSALGDGSYLSALPLLALTMTHDPVVLGAMEACALLPWLFFGLIGGALVDRWDRRRTMRLADLFRFALLAGVTGLVTAGAADVYLLFAAAFLFTLGRGVPIVADAVSFLAGSCGGTARRSSSVPRCWRPWSSWPPG